MQIHPKLLLPSIYNVSTICRYNEITNSQWTAILVLSYKIFCTGYELWYVAEYTKLLCVLDCLNNKISVTNLVNFCNQICQIYNMLSGIQNWLLQSQIHRSSWFLLPLTVSKIMYRFIKYRIIFIVSNNLNIWNL